MSAAKEFNLFRHVSDYFVLHCERKAVARTGRLGPQRVTHGSTQHR